MASFICEECNVAVTDAGGRGRPRKPPHCRKCADKFRKRKDRADVGRRCRRCEDILSNSSDLFCSESCRVKHAEEKRVAWWAEYRAENKQSRLCSWCSSEFEVNAGNNHRKYCCRDCQKRASDELRTVSRRLLADGHAPPSAVGMAALQRDGWKCKACGVDTPKDLRGTYEPNAPEVDHIFPVSRGGTHEIGNLQCLCRKCNSMKSNKTMAEWLGEPANDNSPLRKAA